MWSRYLLQTTIEKHDVEINDLNEQKKVLQTDDRRYEKDHNVKIDAIWKPPGKTTNSRKRKNHYSFVWLGFMAYQPLMVI